MPVLNVVGAGRVGQTLAKLWSHANVFEIGGVVNRSLTSAQHAVDVIGSGNPVADLVELPDADVYLLSVSDDAIGEVATRLSSERNLEGSVIVHCSGSLPSSVMEPARQAGASLASVHPVKSFADVADVADEADAAVAGNATDFEGTYCGYEGDDDALALVLPAFEAIGGRLFAVDPETKTIYHAAAVFAMNYLVATTEASLRCYEHVGIERPVALQMLGPILHGVVDNITRLGTVRALTGPIARGDADVVARHIGALGGWSQELQALYIELGKLTLQLSEQSGAVAESDRQYLRDLLAFN